MKTCTTLILPVVLGLTVSACSTSSNRQDTGITQETSGTMTSASDDTLVTPDNTKKDSLESQSKSSNSDTEKVHLLENQLEEKTKKIGSLEKQIADNNAEITRLHQELDQKDQIILALEQPNATAEALLKLEKEKSTRADLESRYHALKVENETLVQEIQALEKANTGLKGEIATLDGESKNSGDSSLKQDFLVLNESFQSLDSAHYKLNQNYNSLLNEKALLQRKYDVLSAQNQKLETQLDKIEQENLRLGGQISDARAQHQILWDKIRVQQDIISGLEAKQNAQPKTVVSSASSSDSVVGDDGTIARLKSEIVAQNKLISEYQDEVVSLEGALDEGAVNEARWHALEIRLGELEKINISVKSELKKSQANLLAKKADLESISKALASVQEQAAGLMSELSATKQQLSDSENQRHDLELHVNNLIPLEAEINAFQGQIDSDLKDVRWQLPSEMSLHDTFEILVTASVEHFVPGQTYVAELVTDSAIEMISASEADAVVQNGQLQWRWRVSGLNEKPNAKLNLFIAQQMNYKNQRIMRQVYRDSETVSLTNSNLLEKYGYWAVAIFAGLAGGFVVGRFNSRKKIS